MSGIDKVGNFKDFSRPNKEIKYFQGPKVNSRTFKMTSKIQDLFKIVLAMSITNLVKPLLILTCQGRHISSHHFSLPKKLLLHLCSQARLFHVSGSHERMTTEFFDTSVFGRIELFTASSKDCSQLHSF